MKLLMELVRSHHQFAVFDVNSDNKLDIIVGNYGSNSISVLFNSNNGIFLSQVAYSVGTTPRTLYSPSPSTTTAPNTRPVTPLNALPQRRNVAANTGTTTTNATQPFEVDDQTEIPHQQDDRRNQQQTTMTTSSFRRRQRRVRQKQYQKTAKTANRFNILSDENTNDVQSDDEPNASNNDRINSKPKKQNKQRLYLEHSRIMSYLQKNCLHAINSRGNQAYVLATAPIYDEWVRNNYELQVWQTYLKMGTEQKHWAKEVVQRTKRRDDVICTRFVQKKINQLSAKIAEANATISDLQIQLNTYWSQITNTNASTTTPVLNPNASIEATTAATTVTTTDGIITTPSTTTTTRNRDPVDRIEKLTLRYIHQCTQHAKRLAESKIRLAKVQMEEFKALEDFEQIATPLQWNIHLTLKPKMKLWSTKNKNYLTATKRIEYDFPPNFIGKIDFNFKIDESIVAKEEAQEMYNQMRQITKNYRTSAMNLYLQSMTREKELLGTEIRRIIEGFPKDNDDGFDAEPGFAAFKQYQEIREKRMNIEADQSIYFLEEQRVEGEPDNPEQPIIVAPTLTRSLGEDFLLQL
ncbi:unnamed protein product [Rotaria sp. Silwood2]|nr:unnamed protein product [Rotaria sp. Silwood2]